MATEQTRRDMINLLKKGECTVHFKKANGSKRIGCFTLNTKLIPEEIIGKVGGDNKEIVTVWDLEKKAWRSFRVDSVTKDVDLKS